jgi:HEPN domain-containing protein
MPIEAPPPSRDNMRQIAKLRLREAKVLLDNGYYNGAYYLCGYAVECGLKACIAKKIKRFHFTHRKFAEKCYKHELNKLLTEASIDNELEMESNLDPDFRSSWAVVKDWGPDARYLDDIDELKAKNFYKAVADRRHGVMRWLKKYW